MKDIQSTLAKVTHKESKQKNMLNQSQYHAIMRLHDNDREKRLQGISLSSTPQDVEEANGATIYKYRKLDR